MRRQVALGLAIGVLVGACFDSDDKFRLAVEGTTTTTGVPGTTTTPDPSTTTEPFVTGTTEDAELTCRDLVGCIQQCALSIDQNDPEPDYGCITDCTEDPRTNEEEVYHLFRLTQCLTDVCIELGDCRMPEEGTTGTGTGTSRSSEDGGGEGPVGPLPPCLFCIFRMVLEADAAVCQEFHALCV